MNKIKLQDYLVFSDTLLNLEINDNKKVINTINAHSYIKAKSDFKFKKALQESDILLPDGEGVVLMANVLRGEKIQKIAGADIHDHLLNEANTKGLKCFYLGASDNTLKLINNKLSIAYPKIKFNFYSPPFKDVFTDIDSNTMIDKINDFKSDVVFVGMTAPKQEKWVYDNKERINAKVICSIGAVFDFIAETKKRAPKWVINLKLEWFYRSLTAWRLTKRYAYSTPLFLLELIRLKYFNK